MTYDAIVLAGGEGRRLGGISKPTIAVGGRALLDIALDALSEADATIVVGARLPTTRPVQWTREEPSGGGPVAALAAGLLLVRSASIIVLAADLPFITLDAVEQLARARGDAGGAVAVDDTGRDQPLIGCYDTARLGAAMPADPKGTSMRSVLHSLEASDRLERVNLGGDPPVTWDCDTDVDLSRARELA